MDDLKKLVNEYSQIVSTNDITQQAKCRLLSKSKLIGDYSDCWLLLSILLNDKFKLSDAPSFYNIKLGKDSNSKDQLLKIVRSFKKLNFLTNPN